MVLPEFYFLHSFLTIAESLDSCSSLMMLHGSEFLLLNVTDCVVYKCMKFFWDTSLDENT